MNIPFLSKYGTKYTPSSGNDDTVDTNVADPGNTGDFVAPGIEDGRNSVTGINNEYGQASNFANSCGLIFQKEAAGVVEAIGPQVQVTSGDVSVIYQGDVILGRLAMGADYLNPAAAVELFAGTATKPAQFGTVQTATNNAGYQ
jgi:dTDP-glucose pyrophosphorylase